VNRLTYTLEDQALMAEAKNYFAWQARVVAPALGRRVAEIGCGTGNFTQALLDRDAVIAVDIEPACIDALRSRYAGRDNLHSFVCAPGDPDFAALSRFNPDSCVCLNVLEHIEDDLEALRRMASVLSPGGVVVLLVPAFPSLYGPIDRMLGHYRRYTRTAISRLAEAAGLKVKSSRYLNAIGFFGWWANAHILKRTAQSSAQIEVFDRYVVPISSRLESWVHPPFGQSLLIVLKKPS